ncbi:SDR family NAD(P)-dependent oxidoreductase [Brevundimonas sp. 2R-24]|uniref:SDR family NAD(P)-dependent oxidoreductase n=1 Tax=Peiella sedimenti TaxID=3061083 RepID=A0ABT8SJY9_9CAUL|nr:SDR family NAD(P)-dependent oxidoreductase [Caulobacteraceae bacterium XZ-24]
MTRRIIITGGLGVLGRATAEAAAARGWRSALIDYSIKSDDPPPGQLIGGIDLTDEAQAQRAVGEAAETLGGVDALINIAGGFVWETVADGSADTWRRMFEMNVMSAVNACRAALPALKSAGEGRIVNVGAAGAVKAAMGMGAYAASKAGVMRLTEALAEELKSDGVTVNAVLPSIIDTARNRADMPDADPAKWVAPADLAAVILFLASEEARAVTGALVPVTGRV